MSQESKVKNNNVEALNKKTTKVQIKKNVTKYADLIEKISHLTLVELNDFVNELQHHFGIDPSQLVVSSNGDKPEAKAKSSLVNVVVTEIGQSKIALIKAVSKITGKGLLDAKKLLDIIPFTVLEKQSDVNGEKVKKVLEDAGAKAELK